MGVADNPAAARQSASASARETARQERRRAEIHLNLNVRGLKPSATVAINERSNELRAQGREIFKLGLGQSPFPVPEPIVEGLRANAFQKDYLQVRGLRELRDSVADYYRRRQGVPGTGEQVLVGPGSKELMFILQLVYYGDIVIPAPAWVSYAPQAAIIGRHIYWIETDAANGWNLTAEQLDEFCKQDSGRPRILVLNYPCNPTGRTFTPAELENIAAVARRHRVIVLSDEIYGELQFDGGHVSIARFYPEGTIISGGLSKWCGAGGWRLGTFFFPPDLDWLLQAMAAVASETFTSTSAPIQYAAVRAFTGGPEIERYLQTSREVLAGLGTWSAQALNDAGIATAQPQGAFYLFPNFEQQRARLAARGIKTSPQLCEKLLEETGVAILPGAEFGRPTTELTARLAYVDFDGARAMSAAAASPGSAQSPEFLRLNCPNVVKAIERIAEWAGK